MSNLLLNELSGFADWDGNLKHISEEEKALLSVPAFNEKISPAQAHVISASRNPKPSPGSSYGIQPWDMFEKRQQNIVES